MITGEGAGMVPLQQAEAYGQGRVTQVAGDYEEHHHRYIRGWEYLRGVQVDDREMDLVEHAFVDTAISGGPGQVAQVVEMLRRPFERRSVLVLTGEAGSGRRTAALRVLRDMGVPRERIRWLLLDWDRPRTEQIPQTKGHGFVLDLTNYRTLAEDFYTGLADYQKQAEAAQAFLIILASPGTWAPGALCTVTGVPLARPSAKEVAEAHVRHLFPGRVDWLTGDPLGELLEKVTSACDAARLARLVAQATEDDRQAAKQEFTDWEDHLRSWFESHSNPDDLRERALLLAAALLEGAPSEVVMEAADRLFTDVGGALPPGGALAGRDLSARLKIIKASPAGETISLEGHGLADAVLKHVWEQRPQLRRPLLEWASRISAPKGIAVRHLRRIADCLAQLFLLPGGATVLFVASDWIENGHAAHRQLAIEILETMALHPVTGVGVRKQLYDWAHQKTTSEALATAVAQICAGRLGAAYPRVALTRLRLLASRSDGLAREAVADAVRTLAGDLEQRMLILSEIVEWAESPDTTMREAGAGTFLALTDITSDRLLPLSAVQETDQHPAEGLAGQLFVRGWRAALLEPTTAETAHEHLAAWLDSHQLSDDQVVPLAAAVLRGQIGRESAAALLVGSSTSNAIGLARRRMLFEQLLATQSDSPAKPGPSPEPSGEDIVAAA